MQHQTTKRLFGTDGIRGEVGKFPLDARTVRTIGASLTRHLAERTGGRPLIVIGRDTRESGPQIERNFSEGAHKSGAVVRSAGVITTPGVALLARTLRAAAGVVISASHNPYQDNGIKVFDPSGRKLDDTTEGLIERDIDNAGSVCDESREMVPANSFEDEPDEAELQDQYLNYLARDVAKDLSLDSFSIVVDCANGSAYKLAPQLFARLGANVIAINNQPDGKNINRDCGSLHPEVLQRDVLARHADLGVALDGDADRAIFVDADGKLIDGDATMWILANYLKSRGKLTGDTVVTTVMSNVGLEIALRSRGIKMLRTDVGDKFVLDELLHTGLAIGGEQSGHIILPALSLAGDGMITTLCLLRAINRQQKLAQLREGFQRYPQVLINVCVREKKPFAELPAINRLAHEIEERLAGRGRLLLRYSGTEPLARIMIEGESETEVEALAGTLAEAIKVELGVESSENL